MNFPDSRRLGRCASRIPAWKGVFRSQSGLGGGLGRYQQL
jgi:hypothetical protein